MTRPRRSIKDRLTERDSQLSAMFDGELSAAECELLARRLTRDEALRAQWSRFALIGAALRAERGVKCTTGSPRVQAALAQEPTYGDASPRPARPPVAGRPWRRPAASRARGNLRALVRMRGPWSASVSRRALRPCPSCGCEPRIPRRSCWRARRHESIVLTPPNESTDAPVALAATQPEPATAFEW